ncbi:MAG TPA: DNA alkylation repair protein [Candidatus Xenobia bacterium]|nr:DNA alkylation repair protein [Candidatus Xenobia bacterium]
MVKRADETLRRRASLSIARGLRRFFREPVDAYGWWTEDLRRLARQMRRDLLASGEGELLLPLAEELFALPKSEHWSLGVFLLEGRTRKWGEAEFRRLERWLPRLRNWSDCDALSIYLLGPMIVAEPARVRRVFRWARSRSRWARRAAAASLVPAARRRLCQREILRLAERLLEDTDEMVQKGVGWLLREAGKARHPGVVPFLLRVRRRAPRLVLRTACEKLPSRQRRRILS